MGVIVLDVELEVNEPVDLVGPAVEPGRLVDRDAPAEAVADVEGPVLTVLLDFGDEEVPIPELVCEDDNLTPAEPLL